MRSFVANLVGTFLLLLSAQAFGNSSLLSFKEWKSAKITSVRQEYTTLETLYLSKKTANSKDQALPGLYRQLKNSKAHLEELNDLTVTDYFISYLSRYKDKKSVFDAAIARLEPSEVSQVMGAYANSLLKTNGEGLSTSADLPKEISSK
ncbi:MAG: hypothetical protein ACK5Y2_00300 [Bdellovibrionales bacterium]